MANKIVIDESFMAEFERLRASEEAWQKGPTTTDFDRLLRMGIPLPAPDELRDTQVTIKLWEVIHGLAELRTFLHNTDHLSDRGLYKHLWQGPLRDEIPVQPENDRASSHLDILGGWGDEELEIYLKYYADESYREMWAEDFPEDRIPEQEDPPYDRDRLLPQPR